MSDHGTRTGYRRGCRCLPCKAANAAYVHGWRRETAEGQLLLGARTSAVEAWRIIRRLQGEHLQKQQIAARLGVKRPILELSKSAVTVRTLLRLRRLARTLLLDQGPATAEEEHE